MPRPIVSAIDIASRFENTVGKGREHKVLRRSNVKVTLLSGVPVLVKPHLVSRIANEEIAAVSCNTEITHTTRYLKYGNCVCVLRVIVLVKRGVPSYTGLNSERLMRGKRCQGLLSHRRYL